MQHENGTRVVTLRRFSSNILAVSSTRGAAVTLEFSHEVTLMELIVTALRSALCFAMYVQLSGGSIERDIARKSSQPQIQSEAQNRVEQD